MLMTILTLYIGGMIPILASNITNLETGLPPSLLQRLGIAATWPYDILVGAFQR